MLPSNKLFSTRAEEPHLKPWSISRLNEFHFNQDGVTNHFIDDFLSRICSDKYKGTFAIDTIPLWLAHENYAFFVVNLNPHFIRNNGHFVTIITYPDGCLYIDSFGIGPPKQLEQFFGETKKRVSVNMQQVQTPSSNYCGLYCCLFILFFDRCFSSSPPNFTVKFFDRNLSKNDQKCVNYLKRLITEK